LLIVSKLRHKYGESMLFTGKILQNKRLKKLEKKLNQRPIYISYKDWDEIYKEFDDGIIKFT